MFFRERVVEAGIIVLPCSVLCCQREFGNISANLIGQCTHTRTLGYEVVRSNSANQSEEMGWMERKGIVQRRLGINA